MPRFVPARYSLLLFSHPLLPLPTFRNEHRYVSTAIPLAPSPRGGKYACVQRNERDKGGKLNDLVKRE